MKNFKIHFLILVLLFTTSKIKSQSYSNQMNFGAGIIIPDGKLKGYSAQSNSLNLSFDFFQNFFSKSKLAIGLNYGLSYNSSLGEQNHQFPSSPFKINYSTLNILFREERGTDPGKSWGVKAGLGPQFNYNFTNKFGISLINIFGFMIKSNDSTIITQKTEISYNGNNKSFSNILYSVNNSNKSIFYFNPKLRFQYSISRNLKFWLEPSYLFNGNLTTKIIELEPEGILDPKTNAFNIEQINFGSYNETIKTVSNNSFLINSGITIDLNKNSDNKIEKCVCCGFISKSHIMKECCLNSCKELKNDSKLETNDSVNKLNNTLIFSNYDEDYEIDDKNICDYLGVNSFIIKKGLYKFNYEDKNQGGKIIWDIKEPFKYKINNNLVVFKTKGYFYKHCSISGGSCLRSLLLDESLSKVEFENLQDFKITPIVKNDKVTNLEIQFLKVNTPTPAKEGVNNLDNDKRNIKLISPISYEKKCDIVNFEWHDASLTKNITYGFKCEPVDSKSSIKSIYKTISNKNSLQLSSDYFKDETQYKWAISKNGIWTEFQYFSSAKCKFDCQKVKLTYTKLENSSQKCCYNIQLNNLNQNTIKIENINLSNQGGISISNVNNNWTSNSSSGSVINLNNKNNVEIKKEISLASICLNNSNKDPQVLYYSFTDFYSKKICKDSLVLICDTANIDYSGCDIDIDSISYLMDCNGNVIVHPILEGTPSNVIYEIVDSLGNIVYTQNSLGGLNYTFSKFGEYYIHITAKCNGGESNGGDEDEDVLIIQYLPTTSIFNIDKKFTCLAGICKINYSTINYSFGNGNLSYLWKVFDSSTMSLNTYNTPEINFTLDASVKSSIELTVTDSNNCKNSYKVSQTLDDTTTCNANFEYKYNWCNICDKQNPNTFAIPVYFNNTSTYSKCTNMKVFWDFGDGDTSDLESPTHIYNNLTCSGKYYYVKMTLTFGEEGDEDFCESNFTQQIFVSPIKPVINIDKICCDGHVFFSTDATSGRWKTPGSMNKPKYPLVHSYIGEDNYYLPFIIPVVGSFINFKVGEKYNQFYNNTGTYSVYIDSAKTKYGNVCTIYNSFNINSIECLNRNAKVVGTSNVGGVNVKYKLRATALPLYHRIKAKIKTIGFKKANIISTNLSGIVYGKDPYYQCYCTPKYPAISTSDTKYDKRKSKTSSSTSGKYRIGNNNIKADFYIKTKTGAIGNFNLNLSAPPCDRTWLNFY